jgi:hypothetical protein
MIELTKHNRQINSIGLMEVENVSSGFDGKGTVGLYDTGPDLPHETIADSNRYLSAHPLLSRSVIACNEVLVLRLHHSWTSNDNVRHG